MHNAGACKMHATAKVAHKEHENELLKTVHWRTHSRCAEGM